MLPPVQSPRILPPAEMEQKVRAHSAAPLAMPATMAEALASLPPHTLICGSFFLLGEAMAELTRTRSEYRKTEQ